MSWFLLSPRFDATDARPFLSTRPPLARRSLFTTVFKFFQFYLPYALHSVIRFLFNSEILSLILHRVYSLSNVF